MFASRLFHTVVIVGAALVVGPVLGLFAMVALMSQNPSSAIVGEALGNVIPMVVYSGLGGGVLRALVSIDARLDHRS